MVLHFCSDDQHSLFSAARAHSRLHQAVLALKTLTTVVPKQPQLDGVTQYLQHHGQTLESIGIFVAHGLACELITLQQLPPNLQISSLQLEGLILQMGGWCAWPEEDRNDFPGVLGSAWTSGLKQLQLKDCRLTDGYKGLASKLPTGLEHLSIDTVYPYGVYDAFPAKMMHELQQLTFLELVGIDTQSPGSFDDYTPSLQPLEVRGTPLEGEVRGGGVGGGRHCGSISEVGGGGQGGEVRWGGG